MWPFQPFNFNLADCILLKKSGDGAVQLPRRPLQDVGHLGDHLAVRGDDVVEVALYQHPPRLAALDGTHLLGNLEKPALEQLVGGEFHAPVSTDASADTLRKALVSRAGKRVDTPLFAVMHYEMCRLMVQPLTLFTSRGPESLMLSKESFDAKALIGTLKFT